MQLNKSLIINLIGTNKNILKASDEIRYFAFQKKIASKIIENNTIINELNKNNINKELYINKCGVLTRDEIKRLHNLISFNFSRYNVYSYALLINNNDFNEVTYSLTNCQYIHNIYNIDYNIQKKDAIISNILFSNYKKLNITQFQKN